MSLKRYRLHRSVGSGSRAIGGIAFSAAIIVRVRLAARLWPRSIRSACRTASPPGAAVMVPDPVAWPG